MGNDELISDERWIQETLDGDEEVKISKQRMLYAALNDKGEIPRTFRMAPQTPLQTLAENSKELKLARKTLAATRSMKQLQGLYEAIPEGAALVKTSGSTMTIKYPGQDDTVLHKSEVARFGTPAQPKSPLIQFAARKTVINHHGKIQRQMNVHQKDQCAKLKGEKTIRKRTNDSPTNPNLANLLKVNHTKIPPKRKFIQSPKKGKTGAKSQRQQQQHRLIPHSKTRIVKWQHKNRKHLTTARMQTMTRRKTYTFRKLRHQRNQEEVKGQQRSPKKTVTANVPKQMMTRKARRQAPRKSNSLELQIISPRAQHKRSHKYRRWTYKQPAPHILPKKVITRAHRRSLNQHNRWTIPLRSSRLRKREK